MTWRSDRYCNAARRARLKRARRHLRWLVLHAGTVEAMCRADAVRRAVALLLALCVSACVADIEGEDVAPAVLEQADSCEAVCETDGLCGYSPVLGCVAVSSADCRQSEACWSQSKCTAEGGECVRDD